MKTGLNQQLNAFYNTNRDSLYQYALSLVYDSGEAQDIVQASIEKLVEYVVAKESLPKHTRSYVFRCVRNLAIDFLRKRKKLDQVEVELKHMMCWEIPSDHFDLLERSLNKLDRNQKEVIVMKEILGCTFREISNIKEASIFTIASWYRRGMKKLRNDLFKDKSHER